MPSVVVVENERPLRHLLSWALEQEGLRVEAVTPEECASRVDALIVVLNATLPLAERQALAERAHANGARVIGLQAPDDPPSPAYADAVIPSPYRASDVVREIARLVT